MPRRSVRLAGGLIAFALPAFAQAPADRPPDRAQVLVLGVYHMANPGRDLFNMPADDVLAPKRQAEILELVEVLKRFRPTKVAVERAGDWAGADLVADWFRRNVRIYANLTRLADSPSERVLAIFGAGHLGWLRHNVAADPTLQLRTLADLTR